MKAIKQWWEEQVFWWRFSHGKCTKCGISKPMQGATQCVWCFTKAREESK